MDTKELVERCRRGERQAMGLLYTAYVHKMERVSRKYVKNEADVQDIVHDSFVVILTSLDKLRDVGKLEAWMCTIVRNLSLRLAQQPIPEDVTVVEVADNSDAETFDYDKLMALVERLPEGYKAVLKLSALQGLSHKEIGDILGIEPHSSSSQLARAKETIRKNWKLYSAVIIALIAMLLPFLFTHENPQGKQMAKKPIMPETKEIKTGTANHQAEKTLVPIAPIITNTIVAQQANITSKKDSVPTYIAETIKNDSVEIQPIDSTTEERRIVPDILPNDRKIADADNTDREEPDHIFINKKADNKWQLSVSFASGNVNLNMNNLLASTPSNPGISSGWQDPTPPGNPPVGNPGGQNPDTLTEVRTHHLMPLTFGISLSKPLSPRWSIETGLRYTLLRSEITTTTCITDGSTAPTTETTEQKLHYIGIPLRLTYNLWRTPSLSLYTTGGAAADIPLGNNNPVLWSINFGAGLQYRITPSVSLYTEPSLNYYLNPNTGQPTIHTDRPLEFTLPVGLRFSW